MCGKSGQIDRGASVCTECAAYGVWWDQVAHRPAMEITGEIPVTEFIRLVDQPNGGDVQIMLNSVEATGSRLLRYLGRGPDLLPVVVAVVPDEAGMAITYRDRSGNVGSLWRPHRMRTDLVIEGQPVRVTE